MSEAFYEALGGGRYRPTELTVGPWDPGAQHGGPPAALLARAIERQPGAWSGVVARVAVDILSPVPVGELEVESRVVRPGRSVELVEATLAAAGRPVMRAQAWRISARGLELPPLPVEDDPVPPLPPSRGTLDWRGGYFDALEWRAVAGAPPEPGPATVWGRMRVPLVAGEEPTGLQRVLVLADSGNGISGVLPIGDWIYVNTDLTVHLHAVPAGEWICLDAHTRLDARGFGLAASRIFDRGRLVGRAAQSLFVAPR